MSKPYITFFVAVLLCPVAGLGGSESPVRANPKAQLFSGLGPHQRKITTDSVSAQAYFDQGLTLDVFSL